MGKSKDLATGETRFVNTSGDSMTGALSVSGGANSSHLTLSGSANRGLKISTSNPDGQNDGTVILNAQDTEASGVYAKMSFQTAGTERMKIDNAGNVTMPNQPSWCLQPNHSGQSTYTASVDNQLDMVVAGSNGTFVNGGVTTGNSGRVTVPVSGKYFCHFSFRNSNVNTWYELRLKKNGVAMHRGGIWYSSNDYENINISRVISASANDYFTANFSIGVANGIDGYGDQLTFFSGFLIG